MMESIDDAEVPKIISIKVQVSTVEVNLIDFYLKNPSVENLSKTRTFYFEMRPVRTVQVGVIIVLLVHNTLSQVSYVYLRLYSTGFANVWSTGVDVPSRDKLECAVTCLNETLCQSFSYDKSTMKCSLVQTSKVLKEYISPGRCIIPWPNETSDSVELYQTQQASCSSVSTQQTGPNYLFRVYTSGTISACLWMSSTPKNITDAIADCSALGSTLMSVKYVEKLDILKTYVTSSVFIGLDDTVKEGTFIWHDDGTVLNRELMLQIFNSGEPNNSNGKEDCVNYDIGSKLFNDIDCSALRNYVCEKSCFSF
ncbi:C-type lectin domain family 4 member E [Biomphalaria glabrata]|nr:C-type lectin domain family 4 member E [Biomphalaria glabrata]